MKKIKCVIMDWAGTAVDYGCFAPVAAFIEAFAEKGLIIDVVQTRKPMGLPKNWNDEACSRSVRIRGD